MHPTSSNTNLLTENFNFDFVFDVSESPILIEDMQRKIVKANTAFCELFSINDLPSQLNNHSSSYLFSIISNLFEEPEKFIAETDSIIKKNELVLNKFLITSSQKIILLHYYPLFKANAQQGHVWRFEQKIITDKRFDKITNTNFSLGNALNYLQHPIAVFNNQAQFVYSNTAYIKSPEKRNWVTGKTLPQLYSYENKPLDIALNRHNKILEVFETKKPLSWTENNIAREEFVERICYPITNENKNVEFAIETATNITVQKRLEDKLKQSVSHFYNILNSVKDIVIQTDDKLKVEFMNDNWKKVLGLNDEALQDKTIFDVLEITEYELYKNVFSILNKEKEFEEGILSLTDNNKNLKQLKYKIFNSFDTNQNNQGIVLTLSDITTQKLQEDQLIELIKKEKELNELKSTFVNMVSHELRTPLTVISSSAEILELMLKSGKGYEDVTIYTQQIIDEVEKMTAFMQDLLMVSKIEAGKVSTQLEETNIVSFVNDVLQNGFMPWKDRREITQTTKGQSKPANIDAKLLQHALQNILHNAFKYSSGKEAPKLRIRFSKNYFTISVADNGIGIPQIENNKLFTSFFRASNTGNVAGTGIGLMVAKYFTEQHKGYILFKSKANAGSVFTLTIPYK